MGLTTLQWTCKVKDTITEELQKTKPGGNIVKTLGRKKNNNNKRNIHLIQEIDEWQQKNWVAIKLNFNNKLSKLHTCKETLTRMGLKILFNFFVIRISQL